MERQFEIKTGPNLPCPDCHADHVISLGEDQEGHVVAECEVCKGTWVLKIVIVMSEVSLDNVIISSDPPKWLKGDIS